MEQNNNRIQEVSLSELAELMQTTVPRVIGLVENRGLPTHRDGGELSFRLDEVTAWMHRQSFAITAREPRRRSYVVAQAHRA